MLYKNSNLCSSYKAFHDYDDTGDKDYTQYTGYHTLHWQIILFNTFNTMNTFFQSIFYKISDVFHLALPKPILPE